MGEIRLPKPDYVIGRDVFASKLASALNSEYREVRHEYYPDGEPAPKIDAGYDEIDGKHVALVVRSKQLPTRDDICRLMHNAERTTGNLKYVFNAGEVDIILPYYFLSRQDKNARESEDQMVKERDMGKDVGYEFIARALKAQGASRIITVTPHFHRDGYEYDIIRVEDLDIICISGIGSLAKYASELIKDGRMSEKGIIIAPDSHSKTMAESFRDKIGYNYRVEIMEKRRVSGSEVERGPGSAIKCDGMDVIVVDDILSTMGTMKSMLENLSMRGNVDIFAVHGVLPEKGLSRAREIIASNRVRRIVTTDSIDNDYASVSIIPDIVALYED